MYVYTLKFCDIKLPKLPEIIKNSLIISFGSAICSRFIPVMGLSQFFMILYICIKMKIVVKDNIIKVLFYILIILSVFTVTEFVIVFIMSKIGIFIITLNVNSFYRISMFAVSKILEITILYFINNVILKKKKHE